MSWFNSSYTIGTRFDKFLVSRNLVDVSSLCEIVPCAFSDRDFVYLHISLSSDLQRGPGLWKFNNSLLSESIFCAYVSECITDLTTCISNFPTIKIWWDFFKESLKNNIISLAKNTRKLLHRE